MNKKTFLQAGGILLIAFLAGVFYNLSSPNKISFIGEEKVVDFSASDSLLNALRIQDSILNAADSMKNLSDRRGDSLKLAMEKHIQDSLLAANKQDSLNRVRDSVASAKEKFDDSVKNAQNQVQKTSKPVDIKIDFAKALFDKKYRFIDARDVPDFNAGHIQGAVNIPFKEFESYKAKLEALPKDQVYVTYCSSACDASIDLAYAMSKMGFQKLYIFHGGWDQWLSAGYPVN